MTRTDPRPLWQRALAVRQVSEMRAQLSDARARNRERREAAKRNLPKGWAPGNLVPSKLAPWMIDKTLLPKRPPTPRVENRHGTDDDQTT